MACERSSILEAFGGDKKTPSSCQWIIQSSQSSPLFQDLVPVQLQGQPPEVLLQCSRLRHVAILHPSRSSLQSNVEDLSRRSAVSCFLRSSSPVSALYVLRDEVSCQVRPGSPTWAVLLSEPIWHQTLCLHQSDAQPRINLTAENTNFLMDRLKCFVRCFVLLILVAIVPVVRG